MYFDQDESQLHEFLIKISIDKNMYTVYNCILFTKFWKSKWTLIYIFSDMLLSKYEGQREIWGHGMDISGHGKGHLMPISSYWPFTVLIPSSLKDGDLSY